MKKTLNIALILSILCGFCLTISSCEEEESPNGGNGNPSLAVPADFLPTNEDIDGWDTSGEMIEMQDGPELTDVINGGAEIYIEHGFVEGVHQNYTGTIQGLNKQLTIKIYDMGNSDDCTALFSDSRIIPPVNSPMNFGDEGRLDEGLLFAYNLEFRSGKYYVRLELDKSGVESEALSVIQIFASEVEYNISN